MTDFHKIIIQAGEQKPSEHDRVVVHLAVQLNGEVKIAGKVLIFDLGHAEDFDVVKFVDHVVETMGLGEQCNVLIPVSKALTDSECKQLGIESCLLHDELCLTLRLVDIQKVKKFWQMSESEKVLMTGVMKRRGNKLVKQKQYVRAFRTYKMGIGFLKGSVSVQTANGQPESSTNPESSDPRQLLVLCLSNAALCLLHLVSLVTNPPTSSSPGVLDDSARQMLLLCVRYCTQATELDPNYAKSWFRLAKAKALLGDLTEAVQFGERCLTCLQMGDPGEDRNGIASLVKEVQVSIADWRKSALDTNRLERSAVRQAILRRYRDTDAWSDEDDDEDGIEKLPISVWSNHLAANMMSLHEELEAFGEKMPEPSLSRSGRGAGRPAACLTTIQDEEDSEMGEMT